MKRNIAVLAMLALAVGSVSAGDNLGARVAIGFPGGEAGLAGASKDRIVEVRIDVSDLAAVNAAHVDVQYDPAGLEFVEWTNGDLFSNPLEFGPVDRTERGIVDITTASQTGPRRVDEANMGVMKFRVIDPSRSDVKISTFHTSDSEWEAETHIDLSRGIDLAPSNVKLHGNTPNPFNPTTKIRYELPQAGPVEVEILDIAGRLVRTLVSGSEPAGAREATWNGKNDSGQSVSSGIYFVRLRAAGESKMSKMTLIR